MKKHSGMRPHDIVVLLKIVSKGDQNWYMKDLANELGISASEVTESINRSVIAGLISSDKKSIMKLALIDFLKSGLRYVFPQQPGAIVRGIATAHSAPPLSDQISSEEQFVWPYAKGNIRGQAIVPLHPNIPEACLKDNNLYELLALADAIRVGKAREYNLAIEIISKKINHA
ncbi:MAG: hypothetical protein KKD31_00850 [Bacteroidetes bacterium]|nr:hypothetical protein [Bacteroidota bacterium]